MPKDNEDKNIDFNSSMTDLMTSLMVIFILLLVVLFNNVGEKGKKTRDTIAKNLSSAMAATSNKSLKNLHIETDENDPLSLTVNIDEKSGLKFDSDKSTIKEESKDKLKSTYNSLLGYICKPEIKKDIDSIQIIGHTDKNPVMADPKFGNLSLSQDRALSVLKFGLYVVGTDTDKGKCLQDLASINGRGMAELKNTDAESRRVEFKIRVKSYEQKNKINDLMKGKNGN